MVDEECIGALRRGQRWQQALAKPEHDRIEAAATRRCTKPAGQAGADVTRDCVDGHLRQVELKAPERGL